MTDELVTASRDLPLVLAHTSACASADSLNPVRINTLSEPRLARYNVRSITNRSRIVFTCRSGGVSCVGDPDMS